MDAAAAGDVGDVGDDRPGDPAEPRVVWVRHPADVARMVLAIGVWLLVYGYGLVYPEDARSLSARLVLAFDGLPPTVAAPPSASSRWRRCWRRSWRCSWPGGAGGEIGLAAGAAAVTEVLGAVLDRAWSTPSRRSCSTRPSARRGCRGPPSRRVPTWPPSSPPPPCWRPPSRGRGGGPCGAPSGSSPPPA
ncbi:MAG: hypothetical protein R2711_18885 [Acidimicrobiales bacterium]